MSSIIYISRRCQICQDLLITIHKNQELHGSFNIIDIDTSPFPDYLKVVPSLIIQNTIVTGDELFKYINILLDKLQNRVTPQLENSSKPIPSDMQKSEPEPEPEEQEKEIMGFCLDGSCNLDFSSLEDESDINKNVYELLDEGEIKTTTDIPENMSEKHTQVANNYEKMMKDRQDLLNKK